MIMKISKGALLVAAALFGMKATSEDIDIFASPPINDQPVANILLVLDNGANFAANVNTLRCSISPLGVVNTSGTGLFPTALDGTAAAVEQCALFAAIQALDAQPDKPSFNLGIMGFNATNMRSYNPTANTFGQSCVGNTGGCLLMPFTAFDATTKPRILEYIRKWAKSNAPYGADYVVTSNNSANGAVMQEAWAYFYGKTGVSGRDYSSIAPGAECGGKSIIFVGNAYRNNNAPGDSTNEANSPRLPLLGLSANVAKRADPAATSGQTTVIADSIKTQCSNSNTILSSAEGRGVYSLNWARYMKAQDITTFSIGILGPTCNDEYAAQLEKLGSASVGGGGWYPTDDFEDLKAAFGNAISKILAVNSVFASVSLPVSVNTQGSFLNQVFIGMFRPDDNFLPQWKGNLKQFRLSPTTGGDLRLTDADDAPAVNNLTGFIAECARSYWTPSTMDTYWSIEPSGDCSVTDSKVSNSPDGNIVEKGAQAQTLRGVTPTARNVKTCSPVFASCTSITAFEDANTAITQAGVGATDATQRTTFINWLRGTNTENDLEKGTTVMRPGVHGDVVHSRPVAINYGTDADPDVVVFYGGNDGMLRAVNGNRTDAIAVGASTYAAGSEIWSFVPPEFYGRIKRLYENTQGILYPDRPLAATAAPKDYGMDGPMTAFQGVVGGVNKKYLYATMRRGGRVIYAFDVTTPNAPALLWKRGCPNVAVNASYQYDDTGCTNDATAGDFRGIGETWSSAKVIYASGYGGGTSPLLIVGGGYAKCEDYDNVSVLGVARNHSCSASNIKGNKIYVIDAVNGNLVHTFTTERSVAADVTIDSTDAGLATVAYTADTGGNVYRMNLTGATSTWNTNFKKIAVLGCDNPALLDCGLATANRKFQFSPSVVTTDNVTYFVLIGSGDREKPVKQYEATQTVNNHFFMLKDKPFDATWLAAEATVAGCGLGNSFLCKNSLLEITAGVKPTSADLSAKKGWYLNMTSTEQVVTSAITLFGTTTFSTSQPPVVADGSCVSNLGTTRVYNINYLNAFSATDEALPYADVVGDGLPPSPVGGLVTLDNGKTVPFCIGCSGDSPLEGKLAADLSSATRPVNRLYWYIKE